METTARFGAVPRSVMLLLILGVLVTLAVAGSRLGIGSQNDDAAAGPGAFTPGAPLSVGRISHTATLLPDGRVLVAGGYDDGSSAEVRDPTDGTFRLTAGSLTVPRHFHTATLTDDERVLLVGGQGAQSAELWDSSTESFVSIGPLAEYRSNHTATLLPDGRILIVGGYDGPAMAELYDPSSRSFEAAGTLAHVRGHHAAALLSDGRVLIVGGPTEAELWDPEAMEFSPAGSLAQPRWWGTATALPDDRVLVIGGFAGEAFGEGEGPVASAEIWDPESQSFTPAGSLLEARGHHTATRLDDGRVLVVGGGTGPDGPMRTAELWDPVTLTFSAADSLADARGGHSATLLPDHRVLVIGGYDRGEVALSSTEVWDPTPDATGLRWTLEATGRDWPGLLREEPVEGAPVVVESVTTDEFLDHLYEDADLDEGVETFPWQDIAAVLFDRRGGASIRLSGTPDRYEPADRWLAYGLVLDTDGDGRADVRLGMDNAPDGAHRAWHTDLQTGTTIAQVGPPYGFPPGLPDTYFPGQDHPSSAGFIGGHGGARFYAWSSLIEGGRVIATDFAPDSGWLDPREPVP